MLIFGYSDSDIDLESADSRTYAVPLSCVQKYGRLSSAELAATGAPIAEGLITTYPVDVTKRIIKRMFLGYLRRIGYGDGQFIVTFAGNGRKLASDLIERFDRLGWYCTIKDYDRDVGETVLVFEAKYQNRTPASELPSEYRYLYHITPRKHRNKILEKGLCPRSNNTVFVYPERTYFFPSEITRDGLLFFICQFWVNGGDSTDPIYTVFKIDTKMLGETEFEVDHNCTAHTATGKEVYAIYTAANIPPSAIVSSEDIDASDALHTLGIDPSEIDMRNRVNNQLRDK